MTNILWATLLTVSVYLGFWWIQKKTKQSYLNPLLLTSIVLMIFLIVFKIDYDKYKEGSEFITFLIGPATVSLAIPLYENLDTLKKHWKIISITLLIGVLIHALTIGALALTLNISKVMLATFIPKSVTTPIALGISESLGGIKNLTVGIVIITGIFGSMISPLVFKLLKIDSPLAQGLSLGISAHAVGTAKATELGETEKSMATLALIITGILTVISAPLVYYILEALLK